MASLSQMLLRDAGTPQQSTLASDVTKGVTAGIKLATAAEEVEKSKEELKAQKQKRLQGQFNFHAKAEGRILSASTPAEASAQMKRYRKQADDMQSPVDETFASGFLARREEFKIKAAKAKAVWDKLPDGPEKDAARQEFIGLRLNPSTEEWAVAMEKLGKAQVAERQEAAKLTSTSGDAASKFKKVKFDFNKSAPTPKKIFADNLAVNSQKSNLRQLSKALAGDKTILLNDVIKGIVKQKDNRITDKDFTLIAERAGFPGLIDKVTKDIIGDVPTEVAEDLEVLLRERMQETQESLVVGRKKLLQELKAMSQLPGADTLDQLKQEHGLGLSTGVIQQLLKKGLTKDDIIKRTGGKEFFSPEQLELMGEK